MSLKKTKHIQDRRPASAPKNGLWSLRVLVAGLLLIGAGSTVRSAENDAEREANIMIRITRNASQPSARGDAAYFTGRVRIDQPFGTDAPARVSGAHVSFEPGARTAWHTHPLGQTLMVTFGRGRVQQEGGPVRSIGPGDTVWFPPNIKHWHGAAPDTAMGHIAIAEILDGRVVDWMEHVSEATYRQTPAVTAEAPVATTPETGKDALSAQDAALIPIAGFGARGDIPRLKEALAAGLDAGLTVNEIKEALVQLYAYAGFPRSLNALTTFEGVITARAARGIKDEVGPEGRALSADADKNALGAKNRSLLTAAPESPSPGGYAAFAPVIDQFLKEHLFADIFERGVLDFKQREIITISALSGLDGVAGQLRAHLNCGLNAGLTEAQLRRLIELVADTIGVPESDATGRLLGQVVQNRITAK